MYLLIYISSAVQLFSDQELEHLLEKSRKNNSALGVTGMLLYKGGNFMQLLEGHKETVLALAAKIECDPRHKGVIVLIKEEHPERQFDQWSMGFQKLDAAPSPEVPGYSDFLDLPLTSDQFLSSPSRSLKLLLQFKKNMR